MYELTLARVDDVIPVLAIGGGMAIAVISILTNAVRSILINRSREESRRDIAAYVAEGSMTADEGAQLLAAGRPVKGSKAGCWGASEA